MCVDVEASPSCGSQRTAVKSLFFPFTFMWVLGGPSLASQAGIPSAFLQGAILPALPHVFGARGSGWLEDGDF